MSMYVDKGGFPPTDSGRAELDLHSHIDPVRLTRPHRISVSNVELGFTQGSLNRIDISGCIGEGTILTVK